jgi:hypothetical protein
MEVNTGRLVSDTNRVPADLRDQYIGVPDHLLDDARALLAGAPEAQVRLRGDGRLSEWRRAERRKLHRLAKKAEKLARRRSRK